MNKRNLLIWGAVAAVLLFFVFGLSDSQKTQPIPGNPAPDIDLQFYNGYEWNNREQATLTDLRGQVVVLNFWASWCEPCKDEADILEAVWQEYADEEVVFLGVAWSDTDKKAQEFLAYYNISYPNSPDIGLKAQGQYHFRQVPETFVIGKDGIISDFRAGPVTEEMLRGFIEKALQS